MWKKLMKAHLITVSKAVSRSNNQQNSSYQCE